MLTKSMLALARHALKEEVIVLEEEYQWMKWQCASLFNDHGPTSKEFKAALGVKERTWDRLRRMQNALRAMRKEYEALP